MGGGVVGEGVAQGRRRRGRLLVDGDHPGHPVDRVVEDLQRLVGVRAHRLAGHLGGDERVAVPVAADPRAEPDDGRQRLLVGPVVLAEGGLDGPLEARDGVDEGLAEHREHGLHLVGRRRPGDPQRRGALEDVDVLEHPAPGPGPLGGPRARVVVGVEVLGDAAQRRGHGPPARLGGVGGEHGVDAHPLEAGPGVGAGRGDRGADVAGVEAAAVLPVLAAQRTGPVPLLGEVRQVQVHREEPGDACRRVRVEGGDEGRGVAVLLGPAAPLEGVGELEEVAAAGLLHHLTVQAGQQGEVLEHARHGGQRRSDRAGRAAVSARG